MSKEMCAYCKEDLTDSNAKYILEELSMIGYITSRLCSKECLIKYIYKKFKRKIKKMQI